MVLYLKSNSNDEKMKASNFSRRNFLKTSAVTSGLAAISPFALGSDAPVQQLGKLPREVWIATITQMDLHTQTSQQMVSELIRIVEDVAVCQPDIICLPEVFPTSNIAWGTSLEETLEVSEKVLPQFANLARKYKCYMICPVYTSENGKVYNSAVVFDRDGSKMGEYRKIHLTIGEIESGLTLGPLNPTVFQADFGKFGVQICYDIYWNDGWEKLRDQGAEIVFWASAFAAGQRINTKACENQFVVVSSTRKNTSKICDLRGEVIAQTGIWGKSFVCAPVNLEKVLVDSWPHYQHFKEIQRKYGRKVQITTFHEEQWSVIESLSPDVFVMDILKEFGIKTFVQDVLDAEIAQTKARLG